MCERRAGGGAGARAPSAPAPAARTLHFLTGLSRAASAADLDDTDAATRPSSALPYAPSGRMAAYSKSRLLASVRASDAIRPAIATLAHMSASDRGRLPPAHFPSARASAAPANSAASASRAWHMQRAGPHLPAP